MGGVNLEKVCQVGTNMSRNLLFFFVVNFIKEFVVENLEDSQLVYSLAKDLVDALSLYVYRLRHSKPNSKLIIIFYLNLPTHEREVRTEDLP